MTEKWSLEYHTCYYMYIQCTKMFVTVYKFKIQTLLPLQTLHNISIQDGCISSDHLCSKKHVLLFMFYLFIMYFKCLILFSKIEIAYQLNNIFLHF